MVFLAVFAFLVIFCAFLGQKREGIPFLGLCPKKNILFNIDGVTGGAVIGGPARFNSDSDSPVFPVDCACPNRICEKMILAPEFL